MISWRSPQNISVNLKRIYESLGNNSGTPLLPLHIHFVKFEGGSGRQKIEILPVSCVDFMIS